MQSIPSPGDLGFPEKYESWRPPQLEALRGMLASKKRVKALSMPTGGGKSGVAMAYALITGIPTVYITESRGLQTQLMDDFGGCGAVNLWGRRNYPCGLKPDMTCEEGFAARCPYKGQIACPASQAEMRASCSPLVVTNYDKWTKSRKFGQGFQHIQQAILDEGHEAPAALARAMQVILHVREMEELELDLPGDPLEMVNWKPWAGKARQIAEDRTSQYRADIAAAGPQAKQSWIRAFLHYRDLSRRLAIISTARPENWVVDDYEDARKAKGYVFDPVKVGQYGESALLLNVPSIAIVSATLREKTLWMIGVGRGNYDYREFDSSFDPARCPIYYIPAMRVDRRASDLRLLWAKHDQIAARRQDRRGLVQTISFARQDEIKTFSRFADRMIINQQGEAPGPTIEGFRQSPREGSILVSPSFAAGYDFPGADCEWQFVCKIPFPQTTKIIKARQQDDPEYPYFIAMNKLVQIFGRGMRSESDRCENFICDSHMDWFYPRYRHLAPKWFRSFFKETAVVPGPPPRLEV